jgi:hypothetical protein
MDGHTVILSFSLYKSTTICNMIFAVGRPMMGNLPGTDLPNQGKDPIITRVFDTGMPQNGLSIVAVTESYTSARNRDLAFQSAG